MAAPVGRPDRKIFSKPAGDTAQPLTQSGPSRTALCQTDLPIPPFTSQLPPPAMRAVNVHTSRVLVVRREEGGARVRRKERVDRRLDQRADEACEQTPDTREEVCTPGRRQKCGQRGANERRSVEIGVANAGHAAPGSKQSATAGDALTSQSQTRKRVSMRKSKPKSWKGR